MAHRGGEKPTTLSLSPILILIFYISLCFTYWKCFRKICRTYLAQCASAFSNPDQKSHRLFHFYIVVMYKKIQNQLKETSFIGLPKFTIVNMAENTITMLVLVQKICFLRIILLEARCQIVFLADSGLLYV